LPKSVDFLTVRPERSRAAAKSKGSQASKPGTGKEARKMEFSVYILECADGSFYIGHTDDLGKRLAQHDEGKGCIYTSTRRPLKVIHSEGFETRYEALSMERKLKGWSRAKKLAYMAGDWNAVGTLAKGKHRHQRLP
jgi:predicted GIY-YIG superfamily endonuclease